MNLKPFLFVLPFLVFWDTGNLKAQSTTKWNLKQCIEYAKANNITIKKTRIYVDQEEARLEQAKSTFYPNLNSTLNQSFTSSQSKDLSGNYNHENYLTGNYSLRSDVTIFNGYKNTNSLKQQKLSVESGLLSLKETENNIELAVTQAYLEVLYANENLELRKKTLESSEAQLERSKNLYDAGMIAEAVYAQIKSNYLPKFD